jgi:hypothetical protein
MADKATILSDFGVLQHPLVLTGFLIFLLVGLLKVIWAKNALSSSAHERLINKAMNGVFILAGVVMVVGILFGNGGNAIAKIEIPNGVPPVAVGGSEFLSAKIYDGDGKEIKSGDAAWSSSDQKISWSSSNPSIAGVSDDGRIQGIAPGEVIIEAKSGDVSTKMRVYVDANKSPMDVTLPPLEELMKNSSGKKY